LSRSSVSVSIDAGDVVDWAPFPNPGPGSGRLRVGVAERFAHIPQGAARGAWFIAARAAVVSLRWAFCWAAAPPSSRSSGSTSSSCGATASSSGASPRPAVPASCCPPVRLHAPRAHAASPRRGDARLPRPGPRPAPGPDDRGALGGVPAVVTPAVVLYGRPDCHLCDEARAALERVRARTPFALVERDITTDDDLHRRYLVRSPGRLARRRGALRVPRRRGRP
jgi:Glutaredoxin-like domain (DUF836)